MTEEENIEFTSKRRDAIQRENTGAKEVGSTLANVREREKEREREGERERGGFHLIITRSLFLSLSLSLSLSQLARQLQTDEPSEEVKDARDDDKLPLEIRMQGAMAMLSVDR